MVRCIMACLKAALLQAILVPALMLFLVSETVEHLTMTSTGTHKHDKTAWLHYLKSLLKGQAQDLWKLTRKWKVKGPKSRWRRNGPRLFPRVKINLARTMCLAHATYLVMTTAAAQAQVAGNPKATFDSDSRALYVDNGATTSISNRIEDFVGPVKPVRRQLEGVGTTMSGLSTGTIRWTIDDDDGMPHTFTLPGSIYAPKVGKRLLSPQHMAQVLKDNKPKARGTWCGTYEDAIVLHWNQSKFKRTCPLEQGGQNIGRISTAAGYDSVRAFCAGCTPEDDIKAYSAPVVIEDESDNEDEAAKSDQSIGNIDQGQGQPSQDYEGGGEVTTQEVRNRPVQVEFNNDKAVTIVDDQEDQVVPIKAEFLKWHHRLGHLSPNKMRLMARSGLLPSKLAKCEEPPLCQACLYGKATKKPWRTKPSQERIAKTATQPGQCVSIDQLVSSTPGLIAQLRGSPTRKRYTAATVFVDQYSGLSFVHLQMTTNADETVEGKLRFEQYARQHGVQVQHYHADNGVFADNKFKRAIQEAGQSLSFCGVNAHWQNGMAERRIKELQEMTRTMMLHAATRWPGAITANLWPLAMRMANGIINESPKLKETEEQKVGTTPIELWSKTSVTPNLNHWYTFGCPVYVLDNNLQAGKKINKWSERSRVGIYVGQSPSHARSVSLVLNKDTALTSPQYHLKVDPTFTTMRQSFGNAPLPTKWQQAAGFLQGKTVGGSLETSGTSGKSMEEPEVQNSEGEAKNGPGGEGFARMDQSENYLGQGSHQGSEKLTDVIPRPETSDDSPETTPRRSQRVRRPVNRFTIAFQAALQPLAPYMSLVATLEDEQEEQERSDPLQAYAASADPDTMYLHQAMKEPDKAQFIKAMEAEVEQHTKNEVWTLVKRKDIPKGVPVTPAVWSMKRKRRIATREVYKWKARLNFDGSKQVKDVNYTETYAPVVGWGPTRLVLLMAVMNNWPTRQIDYVLAYPQAKAERDDLFMEIPKGFDVKGKNPRDYALKLNRNLYGQKQAGRVWYKHLRKKLIQVGFLPSKIDECVFYKGRSIYILYTDDSILTGPDEKELDEIIQEMKAAELDLTVEGDISDFLGVKIARRPDGTVEMTQPHLIDQVIKALHLDQKPGQKPPTGKDTPAAPSQVLHKFPDSEEFDGHFDYRSVVGKMLYLEKSTRPEIAQAVHQCARFQANPKVEHGKALKHIGRYLLATRDKGVILKPENKSFDCFADAGFAGDFVKDHSDDPDTARSRTGFLITYGGCPVLWASKLQTEIALSATEAEYISLSQALREVIPLMGLMKEMKALGHEVGTAKPRVHCRVFEDNTGAMIMAQEHKARPRTKHIAVKYHHFRDYVDRGEITIHHIGTDDQPADIMTKPLSLEKFIKHRKKINGW